MHAVLVACFHSRNRWMKTIEASSIPAKTFSQHGARRRKPSRKNCWAKVQKTDEGLYQPLLGWSFCGFCLSARVRGCCGLWFSGPLLRLKQAFGVGCARRLSFRRRAPRAKVSQSPPESRLIEALRCFAPPKSIVSYGMVYPEMHRVVVSASFDLPLWR